MNERRILNQIARSNIDFHPIIRDSKLSIDDKLAFQFLLETELNNYEYSMVRGKGFTR